MRLKKKEMAHEAGDLKRADDLAEMKEQCLKVGGGSQGEVGGLMGVQVLTQIIRGLFFGGLRRCPYLQAGFSAMLAEKLPLAANIVKLDVSGGLPMEDSQLASISKLPSLACLKIAGRYGWSADGFAQVEPQGRNHGCMRGQNGHARVAVATRRDFNGALGRHVVCRVHLISTLLMIPSCRSCLT